MSALEELFALQCEQAGLPTPEREYAAVPGRRYRWDFAWADARVLVEINGGTYARMGHSTGAGISRDYAKSNCAQLRGWRTLIFDRRMVESGEAVEFIGQALGLIAD